MDHISIEFEYSLLPNSSSGGLYQSVTTSFVYGLTGILVIQANPKSAILIIPSLLISKFYGLRSLCMIHLMCISLIP